ncbi:HET-domain containing protein [Fusarium agapanthi]|uniref:HET-domain containing protein n=1 Tax=Fusarium agapanthi TaxID=1803897 RepID=A0A9P5EGD4_9HYPO|nr:HET-domain containing protein [Fusarium agapanthi]
MALCVYCRAVDFSALPEPPRWKRLDRAFDDPQLNALSFDAGDSETLHENEPGLPWQDSLDTLAESAALNCPLCTIVQSAAQDLNDGRQAGRHSSTLYQEFGADYHFALPLKRLYLTQRFRKGYGFAVFIASGDSRALLLGNAAFTVEEASPLAGKISLRPFCEDSGSSGAMRVVSSWLKNSVGCVGDSGIKLIEPDVVPMLTTTRTSLHAHISGLFVADLPKTFRDAVSLCRYLGIPYLCIDSLCIIQGDTKDWARESSRMLNVYSNAYLVIAANHASDSAAGCFHNRPSRMSVNVILAGIGLVHAQLGANSDEVLPHNNEFFDEPLTKRAWALQERLLATCMVHYNNGQMYFECRHGIVGDDGCNTDTPYCDLSPVMNHRCSAREALLTWSSIIWNYGDRNLTKPTGKFPALSGIASLLGGLLKDEYVAGLWSSVMVQGLAWQGQWRPKLQPINEYIGPSWSWASFEGIAAPNTDPNWKSIAVVEDWKIEEVSPDDPYGQVKSASMKDSSEQESDRTRDSAQSMVARVMTYV